MQKESPGRAGAFEYDETSRGRTLDAPILSQSTNQARRGTKCNVPGWAGGEPGPFKGSRAPPLTPAPEGGPGFFYRQGGDRERPPPRRFSVWERRAVTLSSAPMRGANDRLNGKRSRGRKTQL